MFLGRGDVDAEVARDIGLGELLDIGGADVDATVLPLRSSIEPILLDFFDTNRVAVRKWVLVKATCFRRSALLVVEPHSRSMVPLASNGIRVDDVTGLNSAVSLSSFSSAFTAATMVTADVDRKADRLLVVIEIGERNRQVAVTDRDGAGFLDVLQRAGELLRIGLRGTEAPQPLQGPSYAGASFVSPRFDNYNSVACN